MDKALDVVIECDGLRLDLVYSENKLNWKRILKYQKMTKWFRI